MCTISICKGRFRKSKLKRARSIWGSKHARTVEWTIPRREISIGAVGYINLSTAEKFGGAVAKPTSTTLAANLENMLSKKTQMTSWRRT